MTETSWEVDLDLSNRSLFNLSSSFSSTGTLLWLLSSQNSTEVTLSSTSQPVPTRVRDQSLAQAEIGVLSLVLALTTLGNSFVLWVLLRRRKHHAPMHLFMINLCVADLVVAFFQVLPQLLWDITERFQGPDALCRFVKYLQIVGMFASSYMIVAMTVDRHYAICCPLQAYRGGTTSRWNTPIMVAWGLALILSLPQVFIFSRTEVLPGEFECWGHFIEPWGLKAYVTWMTIAVFILPALIITVCQVRIFREIHDNIYLKSEKLVTAEFKRNSVVFHFPQNEGHHVKSGRERDKRDRDLQSSHNQIDIHECQCSNSPTVPTDLQNSYDDLSSPEPFGNSTYNPCDSCDPCSVPLPSTELFTSTSPPLEKLSPDPPDPSYAQVLKANNVCAQSRASFSLAGQFSGTPELWPDVLPDPPPPPPPGISKAMSKTVRMTLVIVLVYTICWSPFFIVQLWAAWDPNPPDQGVAFTILMLLASLNSCTNPWIYTAFSSSVSRELFALLRCHGPTPRRGSLPDDSTTTHTSTTTKDSVY
ncbi:Vasopressin V2 receptor [Bagarius yarrelli]|uniref:Vasopressin V2 receptor n=1 Tax=Bagarius yarrelli TaxID=175774 RepID=A0A556U2H3_BAGYA|nr:Vasopressin V2 receptor [Bagarius yarrelli]